MLKVSDKTYLVAFQLRVKTISSSNDADMKTLILIVVIWRNLDGLFNSDAAVRRGWPLKLLVLLLLSLLFQQPVGSKRLLRNSWHLPPTATALSDGGFQLQFPLEKDAACPHLLPSACRSRQE